MRLLYILFVEEKGSVAFVLCLSEEATGLGQRLPQKPWVWPFPFRFFRGFLYQWDSSDTDTCYQPTAQIVRYRAADPLLQEFGWFPNFSVWVDFSPFYSVGGEWGWWVWNFGDSWDFSCVVKSFSRLDLCFLQQLHWQKPCLRWNYLWYSFIAVDKPLAVQ